MRLLFLVAASLEEGDQAGTISETAWRWGFCPEASSLKEIQKSLWHLGCNSESVAVAEFLTGSCHVGSRHSLQMRGKGVHEPLKLQARQPAAWQSYQESILCCQTTPSARPSSVTRSGLSGSKPLCSPQYNANSHETSFRGPLRSQEEFHPETQRWGEGGKECSVVSRLA